MPYFIFSLIYIVATVIYLFFRMAQYKTNVLIDKSNTDTLAMYALFLKADLPFFLSRLTILVFFAISIAIYRRTVADIAYALIMVVGLLVSGDLVSIAVYRALS